MCLEFPLHFYCRFIKAGTALRELCWQEEDGEGAVVWLPSLALERGLGVSALPAAHTRDLAEPSAPRLFLLVF